jgi:glycosyltransferase involved in cell wall biosynthesis
MSEFRISVAMCTYNGARFLPQQLESIAAQTRLPDELVVCDDRSADESAEIVRNFAKNAPFPVRLEINERNLGSTKNFEKAIGLCEGDIVALADQDDVWKPPKLAVLETALENHPEVGYVFSDAELIDERGAPLPATLWESVQFRGAVRRNFSGSRQVAALLRRCAATGATMAFRASLKGILLPIPECFVHDSWISLLASCVGSYGVPIPEALIRYRQHGGQQMGARPRSILEKVTWARQVALAEYSKRTRGCLDLKERLLLAAGNGWACPAAHRALVEEKIEHCSRRAAVHSARGATRIGAVLSEVLTGRYVRFSNSWQSVVEDLCF